MKQFNRGFFIIALLLMLLAVADLLANCQPQRLYSGDPFFYASCVDVMNRAPWILALLPFAAVWIMVRPAVHWLRGIGSMPVMLLAGAFIIWGLFAPIRAASQPAYHISAAAADHGIAKLYYQNQGIIGSQCEHVVVMCDALGLCCHYVDRWLYAPVCFGDRANIVLIAETDPNAIAIIIDGEVVTRIETP